MLLPVSFFLSGGEGEYFLTSYVNNFSGRWGRGCGGGGGVELTSWEGDFFSPLESTFG